MRIAGGRAPARPGPGEIGALFAAAFPGKRLVVVSNREPYEHRWSEAGVPEARRPAGGLTSAVDPLLQAVGGVWIAWGSGEADAAVADAAGRVAVPPEDPRYVLRRVWLDARDVRDYYHGFCNQFLWPLCHLRPGLTRLRARYWDRYRAVNARFADVVLEEVQGGDSAVWFHDYHLALAPARVRRAAPQLSLAHFWHVPWPPYEVFRVAPQAEELIAGLLANDLLGFHLASYAAHFLHCAAEVLGAEVDWEAGVASYGGHACRVRALPISVDVEAFRRAASGPQAEAQCARLRARYAPPGGQLGLGVDRLDYSKGIPERLKALDLLWERHPEFRGRFSFLQVAVPSRTEVRAYDELEHKVERLVWEINDRYGSGRWRPVRLVKRALPPEQLALLYRAADLCIVSSLQDGMNLVAKEFVASQVDGRGVLLLSRFTGAAAELEGCIEINPYDPEDFAARIRDALLLPPSARAARMQAMQRGLRTIYDWLADVVRAWSGADEGWAAPWAPPAGPPRAGLGHPGPPAGPLSL